MPLKPLLLLALVTLFSGQSWAVELPPVTGASYDGRQITWTAQSGAVGYNLFRDSRYHDSVVGVTSYIPESNGRYSIAAFDNAGNHSPWLVRIDPDNVVQVDKIAQDVDAPLNVSGTVYSATAGEVFWDRLFSRTLEYRVFLNGAPVGSTTGSSFFLDSLSPNEINLVSVLAETITGAQSEPVLLEFNTLAGPFPDEATISDDTTQVLRPEPPRNARITLYSTDTAELFWDRPPLNDNIVDTVIFRDGEFLGATEGISFYDADGVFAFNRLVASQHKYELVAINQEGERSQPAVVNPGAFDGLTQDVVDRLLTGITEVTSNNAHIQWFPLFQSLAFGNVDGFAEEVSVDATVEDGVLESLTTEYRCLDGGSLIVVSAPTAIINTRLTFKLCAMDGGEIDGEFTLNGLDAGGYTVTYNNLGIDMVDTMFGLDGVVELSVGRALGNTTLSYQDFQYDTYAEQLDDDNLFPDNEIFTNAILNQQVTDSVNDQPRTLLTTNFTVNASWTNGREVTVSTTRRFEEATLDDVTGNANYISGELLIESVREADSLVLKADTGDASSWTATITDNTIDGVVVETINGTWDDNIQLPCLSASQEDTDTSGCTFR